MQIQVRNKYEQNGWMNYAINKIFNPNEKVMIANNTQNPHDNSNAEMEDQERENQQSKIATIQ